MKLKQNKKGTTLLEYAVLGGFLSIAAAGTIYTLSDTIPTLFDSASVQTEESIKSQHGSKQTNTSSPSTSTPTDPSTSTDPSSPPSVHWNTSIVDGQDYVTGGYPIGTWLLTHSITASQTTTIENTPDIRVSVNGFITNLPTTVNKDDTIVFELFTGYDYDTTKHWSINYNQEQTLLTADIQREDDTTPHAITIDDLSGTTPGEPLTTLSYIITGLDDHVSIPVSVAGHDTAYVSVNDGPWTQDAQVKNNDTLTLQLETPEFEQTHTYTLSLNTLTSDFTVNGPQSSIGDFTFGQVTIPWNNTTWRMTSNYVDIEGVHDTPVPFTVTGTGRPEAQSNIASGTGTNGTLRHGTTLRVDAPPPNGSAIATLTIEGKSGSYEVHTQAIPDMTISNGGTIWQWIPVHNEGRTFQISGGGNPGAQNGGNVSGVNTNSTGRATSGNVHNGFNLIFDAPPVGQSHTITITLDGIASTFSVTRN